MSSCVLSLCISRSFRFKTSIGDFFRKNCWKRRKKCRSFDFFENVMFFGRFFPLDFLAFFLLRNLSIETRGFRRSHFCWGPCLTLDTLDHYSCNQVSWGLSWSTGKPVQVVDESHTLQQAWKKVPYRVVVWLEKPILVKWTPNVAKVNHNVSVAGRSFKTPSSCVFFTLYRLMMMLSRRNVVPCRITRSLADFTLLLTGFSHAENVFLQFFTIAAWPGFIKSFKQVILYCSIAALTIIVHQQKLVHSPYWPK